MTFQQLKFSIIVATFFVWLRLMTGLVEFLTTSWLDSPKNPEIKPNISEILSNNSQ